MKELVYLTLASLACSLPTAEARTYDVGKSLWDLDRALCAARLETETVINLDPDAELNILRNAYIVIPQTSSLDYFCIDDVPDLAAPARHIVAGNVTINAHGSTLNFGETFGFKVSAGASLRIRDARIVGLDFSSQSAPFLRNEGTTILERVHLTGWRTTADERGLSSPPDQILAGAIDNGGELVATNVVILSNGVVVERAQIPVEVPECVRFGGGIVNSGTARFKNSTISDNFGSIPSNQCAGSAQILTTDEAETSIGASLVGRVQLSYDTTDVECTGPIRSDGDNVGESSCIRSDLGDRVRREDTDLDIGSNCPALDVFGRIRPDLSRCRIGASDHRGRERFTVSTGSGLWYDRENDGTYLSVTFVRPGIALIKWLTFDAAGQQVWVYGVGKPNLDTLAVTARINTNVRYLDGEVTGDSTPQDWGTLRLELTACARATLSFAASDPDVGSGVVELERLAKVWGVSC